MNTYRIFPAIVLCGLLVFSCQKEKFSAGVLPSVISKNNSSDNESVKLISDKKVAVYHKNGAGQFQIIEISQNAVNGHLSHGDKLVSIQVRSGDLATGFSDPGLAGKWFFYNDQNDQIDNSLGSFTVGPGTPLLGTGSARISVLGQQRRVLATYQFSGTKLADIITFKYSTYNPSAGNGGSASNSGYLNVNIDFNGTDTWQRRLIYVPKLNGAVVQNTWKEWDVINDGNALWIYSGTTWPVTGQPASTPKTWDQIIADYPGVRIRVTDSFVGIKVGNPDPLGYTENIDALKFGTADFTQTFDFEN